MSGLISFFNAQIVFHQDLIHANFMKIHIFHDLRRINPNLSMQSMINKLLFSFLILMLLVACGNNNSTENGQDDATMEGADNVEETNTQQEDEQLPTAVKLMNTSDCGVCHKTDSKLIGPSYQEIATKYENSPEVIDTLSQKIIKGGVGVWGEVAMTAHPALSQEDAEVMVKYILSLK